MSPPLAVMPSIPRSHYRLRHAHSQKLDEWHGRRRVAPGAAHRNGCHNRGSQKGNSACNPKKRPSGTGPPPPIWSSGTGRPESLRQSRDSGQAVPDSQKECPAGTSQSRAATKKAARPPSHRPSSPRTPPQTSSRTYARAYRSTSCSDTGTAPSSHRRPQRGTAPGSPSRIRTRASKPTCAPSISRSSAGRAP